MDNPNCLPSFRKSKNSTFYLDFLSPGTTSIFNVCYWFLKLTNHNRVVFLGNREKPSEKGTACLRAKVFDVDCSARLSLSNILFPLVHE